MSEETLPLFEQRRTQPRNPDAAPVLQGAAESQRHGQDHDHHARIYRALRDTGTMIWRAGWAGWARVQCGYPEKPLPEEWAIHPVKKKKHKGNRK